MFTIRTAALVLLATAVAALANVARAGEQKPTPAPTKPVPHQPISTKSGEAVKSPRDVASGQLSAKGQPAAPAVKPPKDLASGYSIKSGTAPSASLPRDAMPTPPQVAPRTSKG